jgi:hypothetical protein
MGIAGCLFDTTILAVVKLTVDNAPHCAYVRCSGDFLTTLMCMQRRCCVHLPQNKFLVTFFTCVFVCFYQCMKSVERRLAIFTNYPSTGHLYTATAGLCVLLAAPLQNLNSRRRLFAFRPDAVTTPFATTTIGAHVPRRRAARARRTYTCVVVDVRARRVRRDKRSVRCVPDRLVLPARRHAARRLRRRYVRVCFSFARRSSPARATRHELSPHRTSRVACNTPFPSHAYIRIRCPLL